jgi:hypothetical protein
MVDCATDRESVARVAGRVLLAWKSGQFADLERQIEYGRSSMLESWRLDACEKEKLEVLLGALECLQSLPPARVRAAIRLLEHLAGNGSPELRARLLD